MTDQENMKAAVPDAARRYMRYLLIMAGLGGLLYGVDVGVIAAALPYIEQTAGFNPSQLSQVVAAVLFGSVLSSLFAGYLADKLGRKALITVAAALFTVSIPVICMSQEVFGIMLLGRILQGASAGIVGVVVPLYLAECLSAESRGKGTGMFQFLLTVGLVFAAVVGLLAASYVGGVENSGASEETLTSAKIFAWQAIFWVCAVPGLFLFFGSFRLSESPRYLFRRGRKDEAMAVLVRSYGDVRAKEVFDEMVHIEEEEKQKAEELKKQSSSGESLLQRKYVYPFVLAVLVLAFTQATGINSVLNYSVKVFQQAGLEGTTANWADFTIKVVNCLMTIVAMILVDRKGRKFLLKIGTAGIVVGLLGTGFLFNNVEKARKDVTTDVAALLAAQSPSVQKEFDQGKDVGSIRTLQLERTPDSPFVKNLLAKNGMGDKDINRMQLIITYDQPEANPAWYQFLMGSSTQLSVVEFSELTKDAKDIKKEEDKASLAVIKAVPDSTNKMVVNGKDGYAMKPVSILKAELGEKPDTSMGWGVTAFFIIFIAFYATGPGVCVWLALSELMPARIRSNGMAIALLINQLVSTIIAGSFLPWVGSCGYSGVFFTLGGITVLYFITVTFFLPETKGRSLEEIEGYFTTGKMPEDLKMIGEGIEAEE
ncbi:MFS transporter [Akkermansia sp.]|uniref:MFS transporter n=1 Tax=Akkermansia sp. TaxID=1872421 RepID=UPI003A91965D